MEIVLRKLLLLLLLFVPALAQGDETEIEEPSGEPIEEEPPPKPPPPAAPKPDEGKAKPKAPLQARINAAIEKGVVWLKERQGKDGSYGPCTATGRYESDETGDRDCYRIGPTAFTVFTLRKCGVPRTDRTIKKALKWLKKVCRKGWTPDRKRNDTTQFQGKGIYQYTSYEASAVIMMLVALNKKDVKRGQKPTPVTLSRSPNTPRPGFKKDEWKWMHERIQFLINNPHNRMPPAQLRGGGWRYWPPFRKADQDLSATQFALLGLRAAVSAGYPVHMLEPKTWEWAAEGARSLQRQNGEFSYQTKTPWTAGMTAAGIACMLICREQITNMGQTPPLWMEKGAQRGLKFLGEHLDFTENTHGPGKREGKKDGTGYHYYHLYGIERVGALSGKREI
ncbi:MAG: prenyltransferase/squalene oxidase repeat-containing protein, partial [Planctomycetota bacterium]